MQKECVLLQGGGDLASGVAYALHRCGMSVVILEIPHPLCVRRTVSFAQAVIDREIQVEGVKAVLAESAEDIQRIHLNNHIPVCVMPMRDAMDALRPEVLVNATMAKRNNGMTRDLAPLTIALGPGFIAGKDVDIVVETNRGCNLGKLIHEGPAEANTGIPGEVMGYDVERVLRAPCDGAMRHVHDIGAVLKKGDIICYVDEIPVRCPFDGVVRGLIMNHIRVTKNLKIGDVDPRGIRECCYTFSDKALAIGRAVSTAILFYKRTQARPKWVVNSFHPENPPAGPGNSESLTFPG
ncbi:MAG: selenium-dependent molybdenum cofactor biosynthesis protein YqeB [Syntrophobacter sp.]